MISEQKSGVNIKRNMSNELLLLLGYIMNSEWEECDF